MARRALTLTVFITAVLGTSLMAPPAQAATATRTSSFEYDPVSGLLTKEIIEPNDPNLCLVTEYGYDAFGNKTSVTTRNCAGGVNNPGEAAAPAPLSVALITPRTTSSTYDARGQFAIATTNALLHSESRTFDARFGAVASLTGPNGLTTTWEYDGFGRKTRETRADNTVTTWQYMQTCDVSISLTDVSYCISTQTQNPALNLVEAPPVWTYYDSLNRKRATLHVAFNGALAGTQWIIEGRVDFDDRGRIDRSYLPYLTANALTAQYASFTYDELGRVIAQTAPDNSTSTISYNGLSTTVTNALNQGKTTLKNTQGQTVKVTDAQLNIISYSYDPFGNLTQTTDAKGNITSLTYDTRGRKIGMSDPDMGNWTYAYNALGELVSQVDAKNQKVTMKYDLLGRMTSRNEPDLKSTWTYDTAANGKGKLAKAGADNGYSRTHSYDALGRLTGTSTVIDKPASPYTTSTTYDDFGRVSTQTYPTGFAVKNVYNPDGYLYQVVDAATAAVFWTAGEMDVAGRLTKQTYGNNLVTTQVYDPATGRLTSQTAGANNAVQNMSYTYDSLGNLKTRYDGNTSLSETFDYDTLNRIETARSVNGTLDVTNTFVYDAIGNITCKSDISACTGMTPNYTYNATATSNGVTRTLPHAVGKITGTINYYYNPAFTYDGNGNMTGGAGRSITWNSFNMPGQITFNFKTTSFLYNGEHERIKEHQADGSDVIVLSPRYDTGLHFEKKYIASFGILTGAVEYEHYLYAGGLMFGKYIKEVAANGTVTYKTQYYTKDHLGSIAAITDQSGAVLQRLSYDVWGKRRNLNGSADTNGQLNNPDMYHGYTGHEMLDAVGLIHMNGRLFDPLLGRFVSADPTIQSPGNLQSFNRYSYGWNNPLGGTDPSGFSWWTKIRDNFIKPVLAHFIGNYICGPGCGNALAAGVRGYDQTGTLSGALKGVTISASNQYFGEGSIAAFAVRTTITCSGGGGGDCWRESIRQDLRNGVRNQLLDVMKDFIPKPGPTMCQGFTGGGCGPEVTGPAVNHFLPVLVVAGEIAIDVGVGAAVRSGAMWAYRAARAIGMMNEAEDPEGAGEEETGKSRSKPPEPMPEAEGRGHSIIERPGKDGQYTTHNGDGTWQQYRGSGQDHGGIPRPNVKEAKKLVTPDGRVFIDRGRVRPPHPNEIPGG